MTLITMSDRLPEAWPGLAMQWQTVDKSAPFTAITKLPSHCSLIPAIKRTRYCLKSLQGFATENGFTNDPSKAIQFVEQESATRAVIDAGRTDLVPTLVQFQKHGEHWQPTAP